MTIIHTYISKQRGRGLGDDWHPSTLTTCQCHTSEFFLPNLTVTRQPTSQCITCNICFLWYTRFLQCLMLYINLLQGCGLYTASRPVLVAPAPLFVRHHRHQRPNCFADLTSHMEEVANIIGSWNKKYNPFLLPESLVPRAVWHHCYCLHHPMSNYECQPFKSICKKKCLDQSKLRSEGYGKVNSETFWQCFTIMVE